MTAKQGGICLALGKKCCFYANKLGIVRDRIKQLQDDLEQRRRQLAKNPLWSGFKDLFPFLLPFLGPLVALILILTIAPCLLNRLMTFIRQQIESAQAKTIQVHYQHLEMQDAQTYVSRLSA